MTPDADITMELPVTPIASARTGAAREPAVAAPPSNGAPLGAEDPARLGQYELICRLGAGDDDVVFFGAAPTGDRVAVRLDRRADNAARRHFASVASQPVPPFSCARVLEYGLYHGRPYLVSEYVDGVSVATLLAEDGRINAATVHGVALGSMAALVGLHDTGQAHGNLTPTRVIVTLGGIRLLDQGLTPPAKGTRGRAEDLHQWARLVRYAAAGAVATDGAEADGTGPAGDALLAPALRSVVASAAAADAKRGPTARELLLRLSTAAPTARRAAPSEARQRIGYVAAIAAAAAIVVLSFVSASRPSGGAAQADTTVPIVSHAPSTEPSQRSASEATPTVASSPAVPSGGFSTAVPAVAGQPTGAPNGAAGGATTAPARGAGSGRTAQPGGVSAPGVTTSGTTAPTVVPPDPVTPTAPFLTSAPTTAAPLITIPVPEVGVVIEPVAAELEEPAPMTAAPIPPPPNPPAPNPPAPNPPAPSPDPPSLLEQPIQAVIGLVGIR